MYLHSEGMIAVCQRTCKKRLKKNAKKLGILQKNVNFADVTIADRL